MNYQLSDRYIETHLPENLEILARLIEKPTISINQDALSECAELIVGLLRKRGFKVESFNEKGAPIIVAERKGKGDKTLLFYDHYDVQPPEPLKSWKTSPFEAVIHDGFLYARGSNDNKGNITNRLLAVDALLAQSDELPCSIKFLIEGEEETSSIHFKNFVRSHAELLKADACIWEFGGVDHEDTPMQYLGLRGICYIGLEIRTAKRDIHSGLGGSIFPNAAWRLVWALNSLKDRHERILIDGFYDDVKPPSKRDRELMMALPDVSGDYKKRFGIQKFLNGLVDGPELRIAQVFEPTCTICGLTSGYQGSKSKTIMPARARAKIDFRLVPDQEPEKIFELVQKHFKDKGFDDVCVDYLSGEAPARTNPDDDFIQMLVANSEDAYGKKMEIVPMTGESGPNAVIKDTLQIPIATVGIDYPGCAAHAPNENIRLDLYGKTAKFLVRVLDQFGKD